MKKNFLLFSAFYIFSQTGFSQKVGDIRKVQKLIIEPLSKSDENKIENDYSGSDGTIYMREKKQLLRSMF